MTLAFHAAKQRSWLIWEETNKILAVTLDKSRARMKKRLDKMKQNQKEADRIANEDTNIKLKAKAASRLLGQLLDLNVAT